MESVVDAPDLMIYLRSSIPNLVSQIHKRGRDYENSISIDYLSRLNERYEAWIHGYDKGKLLIIDVDNLDFVDNPEDLGDIINRIEEGSIKAFFNAELKEIKAHEAIISTKKGEVIIENDFVLALTGYQPNFNFLEKIGISLSDDLKKYPQHNPETMETNQDGIYLAGVVCGGMDTHLWFIENSRIHADLIIKDILNKQNLFD